MPLNQAQRAMVQKARSIGAGGQGTALSESACSYIVGTIAADLGLKAYFPEIPQNLPPFFSDLALGSLEVSGVSFLPLLERLVDLAPDADSYFVSLARLHKSRLKYERILQTQAIPGPEHVGPRVLLEYGRLNPSALGAYLFWRKWLFDIDNRAAQETGYLFEPIIAGAIGGVSASAKRSPVRRHDRPEKGRQVDCIKDDRAYEFKLRVTIAASGQGRWREELSFPEDCRESGYTPILVVLDSTPNPKLHELIQAFKSQAGESYVGVEAWAHLNSMAGPTMGKFLDIYVHRPIAAVMDGARQSLAPLTVRMGHNEITVDLGEESFKIHRSHEAEDAKNAALPDDVDEEALGP